MAGGIQFGTEDGEVEIFKSLNANVVEQMSDLGDGLTVHTMLGRGVYLIDVFDKENGNTVPDTRVSTSHATPIEEMPLPTANGTWQASVAVRDSAGVFAEEQSYSWGPETSLTLGDCDYTAIKGQIRYESDTDWFEEEVMYLPDVGITLLLAYTDEFEGRVDYPPHVSAQAMGQ
ncbi:MAG: hypothetical protein AAGF56_05985 [Pseudomonadota bacterium]